MLGVCSFPNEFRQTVRKNTMKKTTTDRRVQRTRVLLKRALLDLTVENGYDQTTVQDILDRANVGRSTFYSHFISKDDLLYSGMPDNILLFGTDYDRNECVPSIVGFLEHVEQQREVLRALIGKSGSQAALKKVTNKTLDNWNQHFEQLAARGYDLPMPPLMTALYINGAMISLVTYWLDSDQTYTSNQVAKMFHEVAAYGLDSVSHQIA